MEQKKLLMKSWTGDKGRNFSNVCFFVVLRCSLIVFCVYCFFGFLVLKIVLFFARVLIFSRFVFSLRFVYRVHCVLVFLSNV